MESPATTEAIIRAKKSIKRKLDELRHGLAVTTEYVRTHAAPIVEPLTKLTAELSAQRTQARGARKDESEEEEEKEKAEEFRITETNPSYGIHLQPDGTWVMGDKAVQFNKNRIKVGTLTEIPFTKGLQELVCSSVPRMQFITENDLTTYRNFLIHTGCHLLSSGRPKTNRGYKYKYIIKQLFNENGRDLTAVRAAAKTGDGITRLTVTGKDKEYVYWDDANEIVDRLALLRAAQAAGNTAVHNEIIACEEELREIGVIR